MWVEIRAVLSCIPLVYTSCMHVIHTSTYPPTPHPHTLTEMCADLSVVEDIHAITGTMKLFLRELPIPLLTFDAYDLCLIAARTGSVGESLEMLKVALSRLPPAHYNTLRHLMRHLHKWVSSSRRKMFWNHTLENTAILADWCSVCV